MIKRKDIPLGETPEPIIQNQKSAKWGQNIDSARNRNLAEKRFSEVKSRKKTSVSQ